MFSPLKKIIKSTGLDLVCKVYSGLKKWGRTSIFLLFSIHKDFEMKCFPRKTVTIFAILEDSGGCCNKFRKPTSYKIKQKTCVTQDFTRHLDV